MGEKIVSICKRLVRYDISLKKQEPIASDTPVISQGAIVTLRGHKGKVLQTEGDVATVSWEDASLSKVPIKDLKYEGRVEKGGPGSGRKPSGKVWAWEKERYGSGGEPTPSEEKKARPRFPRKPTGIEMSLPAKERKEYFGEQK
jgi:hypothetical protein